ncbi:histidine kinase [Cellulosimicrobium sp. CUA-896]|nr:histidine kinase [Cellulosimicrobium sp. CUA-896]
MSPSRPSATPGRDVTAQGRFRDLNLTMMLPVLALGGAVAVAVDARTWAEAAVLALGVVAALVAFVRWAAGRLLPVALPCLVVAAAVWAYGALVVESSTAFFGVAVVGGLVVPRLPRHRVAGAVALVGYVAAVGVVRLVVEPPVTTRDFLAYVLLPTGITTVVTALMFPNKRFYDVVQELEDSREREAELAVARERIRFASDLHDIQGHTLHVVKLKLALARRLVHVDADRADDELREIYALVGDTIDRTRDLVYAQRRLNLTAELENAKNLFEAAGIRVRVERDGVPDARTGELLGQVLRETTTNVLRHAQATQVHVTLTATGITVVNDGAPRGPLPGLGGLAALRERLAGAGGELTVAQDGGRFTTSATLPATDADRRPTARQETR